MDNFRIIGGRKLSGEIAAPGSKNAALPVLLATLLTDEPCLISRVPALRDIRTTISLLESLGKKVESRGHSILVKPGRGLRTSADYRLVKQMRASILVAGPLLARFGRARVPLPGGCAIGLRPIDLHLAGFEALGARRLMREGDVLLSAGRLRPGPVRLRFPSVGATENLMMAAAAVPGKTTIENAAREPEISALGEFLTGLGASVEGMGTRRVVVNGLDPSELRGFDYSVPADRIATGTLLIACAAAGGRITIFSARPGELEAVLKKLKEAGAKIKADADSISISMSGRPKPASIKTAPYPGFPTDLQAPWMALMSRARGRSLVQETIFEKRMIHAAELSRMGARIRISGGRAELEGVPALFGAPVMASDIRAGAALVVAGLSAGGETTIERVYHIDRGYERLETMLSGLGARIRRARD